MGWERQLWTIYRGSQISVYERKEENNVDAQETASHLGMPGVTVLFIRSVLLTILEKPM